MALRTYAAIDLKSFYASVECVERGLDPLQTNLVVADAARTDKTICLAVSPPLKAYGIPGRPRLFEVVQKVNQINAQRLNNALRLHKTVRLENGRWGLADTSAHAPTWLLTHRWAWGISPPRPKWRPTWPTAPVSTKSI